MITIRPAEPGDSQALVDLASTIGREEGSWLLTTEDWRSIADERRYLRAIRRHPDAAVFVAVEVGQPIARLSLSRDVHPASRHVADVGLMVAETHRRRGVGSALLDQAVAWAKSAGVQKLELHVFPWNVPAIALYESFGFQREGMRRGQYLRDGIPVDAILMALWLGDAL